MILVELAGKIPTRPQPLHRLGLRERDRQAPIDGVTSIDREASEYRSAVWVARADGSEPPVQFTAGEKRDTMPRWSPDRRTP